MRKIIIYILLFISATSLYAAKSELDSIFSELDKAIANDKNYIAEREQIIREVKQMFTNPTLTKEQEYVINRELYYKYNNFMSDSAITYTKKNIKIARELSKDEWLYESLLNLSTLYAIKVMFVEPRKRPRTSGR